MRNALYCVKPLRFQSLFITAGGVFPDQEIHRKSYKEFLYLQIGKYTCLLTVWRNVKFSSYKHVSSYCALLHVADNIVCVCVVFQIEGL